MTKNVFRTPYNRANKKRQTEDYTGAVSQTVPDQSLSLRELVARHQRGIPMEGKAPIYDEEDFGPDPRTMDLTEIQEELDAIDEREKERQEKVREDMKNKKAIKDKEMAEKYARLERLEALEEHKAWLLKKEAAQEKSPE